MDIRRYRIPNRALAAVATTGLAVSVEAWVSGAGNIGLWAAGIGFWIQGTGFWATAAESAIVLIIRLMLTAAADFPFFLLWMVGVGDIKFMTLVADCFGLERGFRSVAIGPCLGAVLAPRKTLREGSICQRFPYLTTYIRRLIQSKETEVHYCLERDGYRCVIPLRAYFSAGTLISALRKG